MLYINQTHWYNKPGYLYNDLDQKTDHNMPVTTLETSLSITQSLVLFLTTMLESITSLTHDLEKMICVFGLRL